MEKNSLSNNIINKMCKTNWKKIEVDDDKIVEIIKSKFLPYVENEKERKKLLTVATYSCIKSGYRRIKSKDERYEIVAMIMKRASLYLLFNLKKLNEITILDYEEQKEYIYYSMSFKKLRNKLSEL